MSIVSDDANCYKNDLLIVLEPLICKLHMFKNLVAIHPALQCGKNSADLHLAVGMPHIQRYIREQMRDVNWSIHVITDSEYDGGLINS